MEHVVVNAVALHILQEHFQRVGAVKLHIQQQVLSTVTPHHQFKGMTIKFNRLRFAMGIINHRWQPAGTAQTVYRI